MARECDYDVDLFAEMVRHNLPPGRGPARNIRGVRKHAPPPEREEPTDRKKKKR